MAELEKIIQQQKQKTFDEELDLLLPKHTPEAIDEILDKVPTPSSSSLSETESENSSQDNPFYSKITDHLMAHDGSYRFQCQDEDDTARVWCDYGKAVINVGRKTMHQYIRKNSLEKQRYQPIVDKPRMKSNTRKTANKKQLNASKEVKLFKVVKSKKTNEGTMYKVERSDSSKVWLKVDELYDYPHLLQEFRQENKEKEKARKRKRKSQNKSNKDNDGTSGQVKKTTRNKKTNPKAAKVANPKKTSKQTKKRKTDLSKDKDKTSEVGNVSQTLPKNNKDTVFICKLHHLSFESFKAEGDKKWFSANQRFDGSKCHQCKIVISDCANEKNFVPKISCPAYICINSIKGCKKCLCNKCCVNLMMKDTGTAKTRTTRSSRSRN